MMKTHVQHHQQHARRHVRRGFSLMEVLLLVVVLGIVGGAAGRALQAVAKVPGETDLNFQIESQLVSKMEAIRSLPFDSVAIGNYSTLSDIVYIQNVAYYRAVIVTNADANGDGSSEATFKQVTVSCGGQAVTTLISK
jgi:hypothetical protein